MMEADKEYDLRQFEQMLGSIRKYQEQSMTLGRLINNLDALRNCLRNPSSAWRGRFEPQWATLEEVYAVMLDRGETELDETGSKLVEGAIAKLVSAIESEIAALEDVG